MADPKVELYAYTHKVSNNEAKRRLGRKSAIKKHFTAAPAPERKPKARGKSKKIA